MCARYIHTRTEIKLFSLTPALSRWERERLGTTVVFESHNYYFPIGEIRNVTMAQEILSSSTMPR